jgi:response regulator RpfG family c-di-GMP phosphodiesterase
METTKRVLIVEDDPDSVRMAVSLLRDEPYRLLCASNARDGLKLARMHVPNAILLSWTLPEMNGDQFAEALDEHPVTSRIPLVLFSLEPWVFDARWREKAAQVVNKTYMVEQLAPRLRDALGLLPVPETSEQSLARMRDRSLWWEGEEEDDWRPSYRGRLRPARVLGA